MRHARSANWYAIPVMLWPSMPHPELAILRQGSGTWDLGFMIEGLAYGQSGGLRPSGRAVAIGWRWC